jgi:hypothetical protein
MERCYRLGMTALILLVVWGCGKSSSIEGKVVDGKRQPMAKVKMIAKQVQPIKGYEQFEATTGADGKFVFKGVFPNSAYIIFPYVENKTDLVQYGVESGPEGHTRMMPGVIQIRFTKAKNGVITDSATGLEWYVGPDRDTNWHQAKAWTESLSAAGGGWRMPTIPELKAIYQPDAMERNNMDPIFQTASARVWSGQLRDRSSACYVFSLTLNHEPWVLQDHAFGARAFAVRSQRGVARGNTERESPPAEKKTSEPPPSATPPKMVPPNQPGGAVFSFSPEEYCPLKEGMVWKYRGVSQRITKTTKANPSEFRNTITNLPPQELRGKKVTPRKIVVEGQEKPSIMYVVNDSSGFYMFAQKFTNREDIHYYRMPIYYFGLPLALGNSWKEYLSLWIAELSPWMPRSRSRPELSRTALK